MIIKRGFIVAMALILATCSAAWSADDQSAEARAEFRKLVTQRNQIQAKLADADRQALTAVKSGKDSTKANGEQISLEDRLDLVQLRMETLSARYGFVIPAGPSQAAGATGQDPEKSYGRDAFARGRERTLQQLRLQTLDLLAALDLKVVRSKVKKG